MHPGPVLATLVHAATTDEKVLATLSDDDLIGVIAAVRRIGSFAAWAEMTAIREFATRPDPRRPTTPGAAPDSISDFTSGAASGTRSDGRSGGRGVEFVYACAVAARLPVTFAALRAGKIHPVHLGHVRRGHASATAAALGLEMGHSRNAPKPCIRTATRRI